MIEIYGQLSEHGAEEATEGLVAYIEWLEAEHPERGAAWLTARKMLAWVTAGIEAARKPPATPERETRATIRDMRS